MATALPHARWRGKTCRRTCARPGWRGSWLAQFEARIRDLGQPPGDSVAVNKAACRAPVGVECIWLLTPGFVLQESSGQAARVGLREPQGGEMMNGDMVNATVTRRESVTSKHVETASCCPRLPSNELASFDSTRWPTRFGRSTNTSTPLGAMPPYRAPCAFEARLLLRMGPIPHFAPAARRSMTRGIHIIRNANALIPATRERAYSGAH